MPLILFLAEASLISLSGVMAPGPVTTVVVGKGSESPHAGAKVAIGHGIVEFPLMIAVYFGIGRLLDLPYVQESIALLGGLFLLFMGASMIRGAARVTVDGRSGAHSAFLAGILLTIGNPYFLVWWATVGAALIAQSVEFGLLGFAAFAVVHWFCDLIWDYFLSALSYKGGRFFGRAFQRTIFIACGALLILFGLNLLRQALLGLFV
jgi:threonine/homoserine/homoserine lactone efflux protein